jgi:hypothetical protein
MVFIKYKVDYFALHHILFILYCHGLGSLTDSEYIPNLTIG